MDKLLPNGSIVTLNIMKQDKQDTKFIIIKRFVLNNANKNEYFEYEVMLYPNGVGDRRNILINNEQISEVVFEGYTDHMEVLMIEMTNEKIQKQGLKKADIYQKS